MSEYTRERIEAVMRAKGYAFFTEGDYNLNLLAVRSGREATNLFDDTFLAVFKVDGAWETREYACTTDPGTYWLRNGLEKGTAVLAPGQYRGAFTLGKHKGEYEALVHAPGDGLPRREQGRCAGLCGSRNGDVRHQYTSGQPERGILLRGQVVCGLRGHCGRGCVRRPDGAGA